MGYIVNTQDAQIGIETRSESMIVSSLGGKQSIWTWGQKGELGCAAFEITYEQLARLIFCITICPDVKVEVLDQLNKELVKLTADALSATAYQPESR